MKRNHLLNWTAAPILVAALAAAGVALAQETTVEDTGREISIVVEEGDRVPAQVLDTLAAQELGSGAMANVTFSILGGKARLAGADGQTVAAGGGALAHPEILAGPLYDESYVQMFVDGQPVGKRWRIGTIAGDSLDSFLSKDVPASSQAMLDRGTDYAAVDTGLLRSETPEATTERAAGRYCSAIVDKERDIYGISRVLAEGCSDQSEADAIAQAQSKVLVSGENTINWTPLFTLYSDYGYSGEYRYTYQGCCGDCDRQGYIVETSRIDWPSKNFWNKHISSISRPHLGTCDEAKYRRIKFWGTYEDWSNPPHPLPDWYVGDYYNDRIATLWVYCPGC